MSLDSSITRRTLNSKRRVLPLKRGWDDTFSVSNSDMVETVATTDQDLEDILRTLDRYPDHLLGEGAYTCDPAPLPTKLARYVRSKSRYDLPPEDFKVIQFSRGRDKVTQNIIYCENPGTDQVEQYAFSSTYKFCTLHQDDEITAFTDHGRVLLEWEFPFAIYQNIEGEFKAVMHPNASLSSHEICHGSNTIPSTTDDKARFYWDILSNRTCLGSPFTPEAPNISIANLVPVSVTAYYKEDGEAVNYPLDPNTMAQQVKDLDGFNAFSFEDGNPQLSETYRCATDRYTNAYQHTLKSYNLLPIEVRNYFLQLHETWKSTTTQS